MKTSIRNFLCLFFLVFNINLQIFAQQPIKTFQAHDGKAFSVSFSSDNNLLVTSGKDGFVNLWNTNTWQKINKFEFDLPYSTFDRNGNLLITEQRSSQIIIKDNLFNNINKMDFDIISGADIYNAINISNDSKYLFLSKEKVNFTLTGDKIGDVTITGYIEKYSINAQNVKKDYIEIYSDNIKGFHQVGYDKSFETIYLSPSLITPDNKYLVVLPYLKRFLDLNNMNNASTPMLRIVDIEKKKILKEVTSANKISLYPNISMSPDGKKVSICNVSNDKWIYIANVESGTFIKTLKGESDWVQCMAFTSDSKYLASGDQDEKICLWDLDNGKLLKKLKGHTDDISGLSFSSDGKYLASSDEDGIVRIWDAQALFSSEQK